jgi:hypothetical protein
MTSLRTINSTRVVYTQVRFLSCNKTWFIFLIIASGIPVCAAIASGIVRLFLRSPDVLDLVSAMTRPNNIKVPQNGSFLDGEEISRLLGEMRIQLGDSERLSTTGRVNVGRKEDVVKLQRNRLCV